MFRLTLVVLAAFTMFVARPSVAQQQQPACTDRTDVVDHLSQRYSEKPVAMGMANNGGVIEILASKSGVSWTIILTMPNGMTCMIAAGENWEALPQLIQLGPSA